MLEWDPISMRLLMRTIRESIRESGSLEQQEEGEIFIGFARQWLELGNLQGAYNALTNAMSVVHRVRPWQEPRKFFP